MPELPEVENMMRALSVCQNNFITNIYTSHKKLRKEIQSNLLELVINSKIDNIYRRAKYLICQLSNHNSIIMHAGMSGNFFLEADTIKISKHDHVILYLSNHTIIRYNDPRRFGLFFVIPSQNEALYFKNFGPDATSNQFNFEYFQTKVKQIKSNIKNTLLNQKIVAGIGNIYASESLFYAKINPTLSANSLTDKDITKLIFYIKDTLNKSIEYGGSTLKDYRQPNGASGNFQNYFAVYAKEKTQCIKPDCHGTIIKIIQNGRSTFYCNICQK